MGLIRGILALVLLGAVVAPAHAMTEDEERAKAHFLAGQSYYEQASYTDALKEFGEAYRISKKPALLYNLARCHEALDHYADAVAMLERYLQEDPDASDRDAIQSRIEHLKERQRAAEQARAAAPRTPPPSVAASVPPPSSAPAHRPRKWTWIVGGIGVAALAAALGTGIASQLDYNSLGSSCTANQCDPSKAGDLDRGKQLALATDVLWPVGAAAVATAVVLFVIEGRHAAKHAHLAPASGGSTFALHF